MLRHVVPLFLIFAFPTLRAFADAIVSIDPSSLNLPAGQTFSVDVSIPNVADLFAFQFDLGFDPTVLSATGITEGSFLSGGGATFFIPGTIDNTLGTISFTANTLLGNVPGVTGRGILAIANFAALASGTSPVNLSNVIVLDSNLSDIPFSTAGGSVTVASSTAIPEPSSLLLFTSGLLSLGICGRRIF
jgi:general secretion pathway protein D